LTHSVELSIIMIDASSMQSIHFYLAKLYEYPG